MPFAKNDLTSDIIGNISGGGGFADSYYVPFIFGWNKERVSLRLLFGFLAPTGRYASDASNNVGSGMLDTLDFLWPDVLAHGQQDLGALSTFEMYEFHTPQEGTETHPGQTFDLDYSLVRNLTFPKPALRLEIGVTGYEAWQTTAHFAPPSHPPLLPTVTPSTPSVWPHKSLFQLRD
jgi:hypothetical protein